MNDETMGKPPAGGTGQGGQHFQAVPPQFQGQPGSGPQFGPPQQSRAPQQFGAPAAGPPMMQQPYGMAPGRPGNAFPLPRAAAIVIVVSGLGTLIASLFALYSTTINPAKWDFLSPSEREDFRGTVSVSLGFWDTVPLPAPIIASAIPLFMLFAGLAAVPMVLQGRNQKPVIPAFFTLAATLISIVLMISGPLPGIKVTGELAEELRYETGTGDLNKLIDTVVPISPGVGLILAFVFSLIGVAAALFIYITAERGSASRLGRPAAGPFGPPQPHAGFPPQPQYGGPITYSGAPPTPAPGWQPPTQPGR